MNQDSGVEAVSLKVDGGMTANSLLMQFQADLLGVQVIPFWMCSNAPKRPRKRGGVIDRSGFSVGPWLSMVRPSVPALYRSW